MARDLTQDQDLTHLNLLGVCVLGIIAYDQCSLLALCSGIVTCDAERHYAVPGINQTQVHSAGEAT